MKVDEGRDRNGMYNSYSTINYRKAHTLEGNAPAKSHINILEKLSDKSSTDN